MNPYKEMLIQLLIAYTKVLTDGQLLFQGETMLSWLIQINTLRNNFRKSTLIM